MAGVAGVAAARPTEHTAAPQQALLRAVPRGEAVETALTIRGRAHPSAAGAATRQGVADEAAAEGAEAAEAAAERAAEAAEPRAA